jgi:asparagine synthase (glutamine-hydrolysing)
MCAIAGVAGRTDGAELVRRMTAAQRHRGPDDEGVFVQRGIVALGHRRLAILDPSEAGRQPMSSRDGRWTMVLNGEIFNYRELAAGLGQAFRSGTDTEVLLEACAAWGIDQTLGRAVGMFAFALWDSHRHELTLARDRMGEKPLVYFWAGPTLAFASELKALDPFHGRRLEAAALDAYLALGYVPAPLAIFRGCHKLPPGHLLRFREGRLSVTRWWFPEDAPRVREKSRVEFMAGLRERLAEAVRLRLRADVPLALYLSGGVDSSVIAAECVRQGARPEAFTARFDGQETDLPYARQVAQALQLPHHVLDAHAGPAAVDFERLLWHYDEPFADSSAVPCFALARAIGGRYKVVLNGDGGDEALGGYRHYEHIGAKQALKAAAAATGLCDGAGAGKVGVYVQSKAMFRAARRRNLLHGHWSGNALDTLLSASPFRAADGGSALARALWTDRHLSLANGLTYKMDTALGAFGMEGRAPFLDHRLLEWTQSLPAEQLVHGSEKKILLRDAYAGQLPPQVLNRPKHGFGAPVGRWLRGPLREVVAEALPCPLLEREAQRNWTGQRLWTLLTFSKWARQWRATW